MGSGTNWKVYDRHGEFIASFRYVADAAQFIALEHGRSVRYGHPVKHTVFTNVSPWEQDSDPVSVRFGAFGDAGASYDAVTEAAFERFPGVAH